MAEAIQQRGTSSKKNISHVYSFPLLALAGLFCISCVPVNNAYLVKTDRDPVDNYQTTAMLKNALVPENGERDKFIDGTKIVDLGIRLVERDSNKDLSLVVSYVGPGWIFISSGESLVLKVDGERLAFKSTGSIADRNLVYGDIVQERASYPVKDIQLRKIAGAKEVTIKLIGDKGYSIWNFDQLNFKNFQRFIDEEIDQKKPEPSKDK